MVILRKNMPNKGSSEERPSLRIPLPSEDYEEQRKKKEKEKEEKDGKKHVIVIEM